MRRNKLASLVLILLCVVSISGCGERELILQSREEVQWKSQGEAGGKTAGKEGERERMRQLTEKVKRVKEAKRQSDALRDTGLDGVSRAF